MRKLLIALVFCAGCQVTPVPKPKPDTEQCWLCTYTLNGVNMGAENCPDKPQIPAGATNVQCEPLVKSTDKK